MKAIVTIEPYEGGYRWEVADPDDDMAVDAGFHADPMQAIADMTVRLVMRFQREQVMRNVTVEWGEHKVISNEEEQA